MQAYTAALLIMSLVSFYTIGMSEREYLEDLEERAWKEENT